MHIYVMQKCLTTTSAGDQETHQGGRAPIAPLSDRSIVFISHANPEDNAITAWYGARLSAAGYEVWTDLTRLLGGEEMWLDIDDALRFHARKVVVLMSRAAVDGRKEGVRAEIDRAHAYRKKLGDRRFIIPVRIDDVPFDELPPTIGNRTVIDEQGNHAAVLARIIKILEEDGVPRTATPAAGALLNWYRVFGPEDQAVERVPDNLVSNWYAIRDLPETINLYEINRPLNNPFTDPAAIARDHPLPMAAYMRRLVSFAEWDDVQEPIAGTTPIKLDRSLSLAEFLAGGNGKLSIHRGEARKLVTSLLRQAFDNLARSKGLMPFKLSDNKTAWYVSKGLMADDKVSFQRTSGQPGWRKLCGVYSARDRLWHFAVNAVPIISEPVRLRLAPHIVYTDPKGEMPDTAEYRRAHCKLWFNAKWRDLLYAGVTVLTEPDGFIHLPFGGATEGLVVAMPQATELPVRPSRRLETRSALTSEDDGDAADLDVTSYADDPAFSALFNETGFNGDERSELSSDEEENA